MRSARNDLTNFGNWLWLRLPHIQSGNDGWWWHWRVFGLRPYYRCCIIDVTSIENYPLRVALFGYCIVGEHQVDTDLRRQRKMVADQAFRLAHLRNGG
jgi:hypothetical protein